MKARNLFNTIAKKSATATGSPWTFLAALAIVVLWGITGPLFNFNDTWQLVINTGTTIITFLMVFLIQNTQNRDGAAIQIKLDELILTSKAENDFIGIEKLTDKELAILSDRCATAASKSRALAEKADAEIAARKHKHAATPKAKGDAPAQAAAQAKPAPRKPRARTTAAARKPTKKRSA